MESRASAAPEHKGHEKWLAKRGELLLDIEHLEAEQENIKQKKKAVPHHITWEELPDKDKFEKISPNRRRMVNTIAMIAYRAETAMAAVLCEKTDSNFTTARKLVRNLYSVTADILPENNSNILRVRLHGNTTLADRNRIDVLLKYLNETEAAAPGTDLKIIYGFVESP